MEYYSEECFTVIILNKAVLSEDIQFDNFLLLKTCDSSGPLGMRKQAVAESTLINKIQQFTNAKNDTIENAIFELKQGSNIEHFYFPILVVKNTGHYNYLSDYSISQRSIIDLKCIFNILSVRFNVSSHNIMHSIAHNKRIKHYVTFNSSDSYVRSPINSSFYFKYSLDFLSCENAQNDFLKLHNTTKLNFSTKSILTKFKKAFKFLNMSIEQKDTYEKLPYTVLHLLIAAETLFVNKTRGEKKYTLSKIFNGILPHSVHSNSIDKAIVEVYNARSFYLHAGKMNFVKFTEKFKEIKRSGQYQITKESDSLEILLDIMVDSLFVFVDYFNNNLKLENNSLDLWDTYLKQF
ncbi:MAG: HEPN domain-containing protein [Candidatus Delongbacteria bacterium]|jgi:hypothetical protein|nr:HEPN domain-containing protein [Candidatus Delongbacteria bacterium]